MDNKLSQKLKVKSQKWQLLLLTFAFLTFSPAFSQNYKRVDSIPVKVNGNFLKHAWTGGHNYVQFSEIDMNFDGKKDLFVFDRTGHKVTTYINKGTPNTVAYVDSSFKYASKFPHLEDWALLHDYNCDGKPDIFTYAITVGGMKVWKNTSSGGNLQFTLQSNYLKSDYTPSITTDPLSNLYITRVDLPSLDDVDGDGDMDVLTFDYSSTAVEFHINKSKELGFNCDSLVFILDPNGCWGNFQEDPNTCSLNLTSCRKINPDSIQAENSQRGLGQHTGSCSLCLDMDGDNDKDIIVGDISCCNLSMLTNGGSAASANMTAKDTAFPSSNIPVSMNLFPCGFYVDVDNDAKRDLIVCPNAPNVSVDNESIWFYKNVGADNAPIFNRIKRNLFQDEMIDVGQGADPVFFDFNADGLTDLLVSGYAMIKDSCPASNPTYGVFAYQNIGTAANPQFNRVSTDFANLTTQLSGVPGKHLTFGDLDDDGDDDMVVGDYNGYLHYFNNTAGPSVPCTFNYIGLIRDVATPNDTFADIGSYSTPQLIDVDRDGDLDIVCGERSGNLNFFTNIGTASSYTFELTTNTFGDVDVSKFFVTGYSAPFMYDSLGDYHLIVGSEASRNYPASGWLWKFKDIGTNLSGSFTLVDSLYKNIWEGSRMIVHGADITNDGSLDLAIGNYAGGVTVYLGDSSPVAVHEVNSTALNLVIFPNPSSGKFRIQNPELKIQKVEFCNLLGESIARIEHPEAGIIRADLSSLPNGFYICKVYGENFNAAKKIVIQK